ncbi:MAG: hypothetical protein KKF44_01920 [Nanoarchaeota archaeon]|nr:hypothetical protein [Nanoarchaeota archaeon]
MISRQITQQKKIFSIALFSKEVSEVLVVSESKVRGSKNFIDEKSMLEEFRKMIVELDPDIITGWNVVDFDLNVLERAFRKNNIEFNIGRDDVRSRIRTFKSFFKDSVANISGRIVLDGISLMKMSFISFEDYKLQTAAHHILGEEKSETFENVNKGEEIERFFIEDKERLVKYNLLDAKLVYDILDRKKLIDLCIQRTILTGMQLDRVGASIASLDNLYLSEAKKNKIVCNNSDYNERNERIKGGFVQNSFPGIYDFINVLDFKSLYPSIIRTFNIDPVAFASAGKDYIEAPNGARFSKEEGLLPLIIQRLWEQRDKAKKKNNLEESYAIKITMNCFSSDSQILTNEGVKNIKNVKNGDLVYTFNPKNDNIELMPVTKTVQYDYDGDLIAINTSHVDFLVTPNHRFLIHDGQNYEWREASDLAKNLIKGWLPKIKKIRGKQNKWFDLQKECSKMNITYKLKNKKLQKGPKHSSVPKKYKTKDWLEFLGWYISEGHIYVCKPKKYEDKQSWRGISHRITISQENGQYRQEIMNLFDRMNLKYSIGKKIITVTNQIISEILLNEIGQGSHIKRIPNWVFEYDYELLEYLFTSLMKGDGDSRWDRYSTASKGLAQDFLRLLFHIGLKGSIYSETLKGFKIYRVQVNKKRGIKPYLSKYRNFGKKKYKGKVYCVEVPPYHTIIAGRNNKLNICGQSFFGVLANPMCRFYSLDMANAITSYGRMIVKKTAEIVEEEGFKVIYGDTDSIFVESNAINEIDAQKNGKIVSKFVNQYWKEYVKKKNTGGNNYLELQFEKCFLRFLMPMLRGGSAGAKKRYAGIVNEDGKETIKFTGLEFVRRDWTELSKKFQLELLDRVFKKKEVADYVEKFVKSLEDGKFDDLLIYRRAIRKELKEYTRTTPPHVKAARKLREVRSNIIAYVMTEDGPEPVEIVKHKIDYGHYIEKQIKPIADSILVFYGKSFDDILKGSTQKNLFSFS